MRALRAASAARLSLLRHALGAESSSLIRIRWRRWILAASRMMLASLSADSTMMAKSMVCSLAASLRLA